LAKEKARTATRKVKDKWRAKSWYMLHAPEMFDYMALGETPAEEPGRLQDRIIEATAQEITGDYAKMHIKLNFKVHQVRGTQAFTHFVGHELTSDYVRKLTRRRRTRTDIVVDVPLQDGTTVRLKPIIISDRRVQASKQNIMRKLVEEAVRNAVTKFTVGELVRAVISGELAKACVAACKQIQPVQRVEIRKSEVRVVGALPEPAEGVPMTPTPSEEEQPGEVPSAEEPLAPPPPPGEEIVPETEVPAPEEE